MSQAVRKQNLSTILEPINFELGTLNNRLFESLQSQNPFLDNILSHIISSGGKRLRPAMVFLLAKALNGSCVAEEQMKLAQAVELVHTATLIHDDVVDDASVRRNSSTINFIWGDKAAILCGDYLLSKALNLLMQTQCSDVVAFFADNLSKICVGEVQQLAKSYQSSTVEEYIEKSKRKTALLFASGAKGSAMLSSAEENVIIAVENFAVNFGIAFQIVDDILNFVPNSDKPTGLDVQNGVYTLPIIFALEEGNHKLDEIIKKEDFKQDDVLKVLEILKSTKALQRAKDIACQYSENAISQLERLEQSVYTEALINLTKFNPERI